MSTTEGDDEEGIDPHLLLALAMLGIIKVKPPPLMKKGDQIRGYEFLGQLGEGGFGEVWAVKKNEKLFAIKVMKNEKDVAGTELIFSDKLHLKNPFLVEYFESFRSSDNALAFIVMELCKQGDLDGLVKKLDPEKGIGLQAHRIMKIFTQLILGLHELHRNNIIHRDLKLGNVFVDENDNIKIGDFGAARILNSAGELRKTMVGTPLYMSPEQFSKEAYGQSVDLWALGVMMYELCTTKMPFMAQTKAELEQKIKIGVYPPIPKLTVPNEIITAIDNLLSKDPKKRPNTTTLLKIPLIQECAKDSDLLKYFPKDVLLNKPSSPSNKGWPGGPTPSQPTSSAPKPSAPAAHPKPKGNANPAGPGGPNPNQQKPAGGKPGPGGPGGPNQWGPSGGGAGPGGPGGQNPNQLGPNGGGPGPGGPGGQNPNQWGPNGGGPGPGGPGGQDSNQWGPNGTQFGPGGRGGQNPNQWGPNGGGPGPGGPGGQNPNQWGPNGTQFGPGGRGGQNPNQWGPNGGGPGPGSYGGFAPGPYGGFPPGPYGGFPPGPPGGFAPGPYGGFPPGPPGGFAPGPYGGFPPGPPGPFQGFPPGPYPGGFPGGPCGTQFGPGGGTGSKKKITPPVSDYGSPPPSGGGGAGRKTFIWRNTNPSNDDNKIWDRIQGKYGGGINMFRVRDNAAAFQIIDGIAPAQRNLVYVASNRGSQGIEFLTECRARPHGITTPSVIFCMNKEGWVPQDWVELSVANSALDDFLEEKVKNGNW